MLDRHGRQVRSASLRIGQRQPRRLPRLTHWSGRGVEAEESRHSEVHCGHVRRTVSY